jgi:hypothetical protein
LIEAQNYTDKIYIEYRQNIRTKEN